MPRRILPVLWELSSEVSQWHLCHTLLVKVMTGQPPGRLDRGAEAVSGCKSIRKYLTSLIGHSQSRRPHKSMTKEGTLRSRLILMLTALHSKLILCETQTEMKNPCIPHKHLNCQEQTQQEKLMPCFKKQQINWFPIALPFNINLVIPFHF